MVDAGRQDARSDPLVDALSVVDGVAYVRRSGMRRPAMRVWVDPKRLAARGLAVTDIEDALRRENVQIPSGRLESSAREFTLRTDTGFRAVADFEKLVRATISATCLLVSVLTIKNPTNGSGSTGASERKKRGPPLPT